MVVTNGTLNGPSLATRNQYNINKFLTLQI